MDKETFESEFIRCADDYSPDAVETLLKGFDWQPVPVCLMPAIKITQIALVAFKRWNEANRNPGEEAYDNQIRVIHSVYDIVSAYAKV